MHVEHNRTNRNTSFIFKRKRTDESFHKFWTDVTYDATALDIDEPTVPRVRRRPARFVESTADAHVFSDAKSLHRKQYFEIIDAAITSLEERFHSQSFKNIRELESKIVRTASVDNCDLSSITDIYKELSHTRLQLHFEMFRDICRQRQIIIHTVSDIADFLRENTAVREILSEVFCLIRLFLTIPVTTLQC